MATAAAGVLGQNPELTSFQPWKLVMVRQHLDPRPLCWSGGLFVVTACEEGFYL